MKNKARGRSNQGIFAQIPNVTMPRSTFNRSYNGKTTFDAGHLVPILVDKVVPGDTYRVNLNTLARLATAQKPVMDDIYINSFFFFVPNRLVWSNFERFMGARVPDPDSSIDFLVPQVEVGDGSGGVPVMSIYDYAGIPPFVENLSFSALPFRGMNLIFNEWFRDQNLQDSLPVPMGDGPDPVSTYNLFRRGKRHDYFTSCLPEPQKGPAVQIPGSEFLFVHGLGKSNATFGSGPTNFRESDGQVVSYATYQTIDAGTTNQLFAVQENPDSLGYPFARVEWADNVEATINNLRTAEQLQVFYERDNRGGTRFVEVLRSQYGVTSPDARLQRPEFLGGGSARVNVSPIAQTSDSGAGTPQGNLAAMGVQSGSVGGFTHSFPEHGWIIGFISCQANISYQNNLERTWITRTREEELIPAFANLGEQAVLYHELDVTQGVNAGVFGYNERYSEYRYKPSLITGLMRSQVPGSLDVWHLAQDFLTPPALNAEFIVDDPPIDRVIAVPSEPHFILDYFVNMTTTRILPTHPMPGDGSRF